MWCPGLNCVDRPLDEGLQGGVGGKAAQQREVGGGAGVTQDDKGIAAQAPPAGAGEGGLAETGRERFWRKVEEEPGVERGRWQVGLETGIGGVGGAAVPGADLLADIAAEEPVAHSVAQLHRGEFARFDGEVRDAPAGVEHVRGREGVGGTGVEAAGAGAAVAGGVRGVVVQFDIDQHGRQKQPTAEAFVDQQGVFAKPSESRGLGEVALENRGGIDDAASLRMGNEVGYLTHELAQSAADHLVVVDRG